MPAFLEKLRRGGWVILLGAVLVAALVWFGGPYLGIAGRQPLTAVSARLVLLLVLAALVMAVWLLRRVLLQRRARRMAAALDDDEEE